MDERYDPVTVEAKWQRLWRERRIHSMDVDAAERPYYTLMMFPYPSAEGLHVGHAFAFSGVDIHGRLRRLQGYDVFEPLGFDAFGIHSENYALNVGTNPKRLIPKTIENFRRQLSRLGLMVEWEHAVDTTASEYYRWTQWIFLKLYERGLAVRQKAPVNWCPRCQTVLANEQVIDGDCERHPGVRVEQRLTEQWFLKITEYAERLLCNLDWIDWSESTKMAQRNWIGRSEGAAIDFALASDPSRQLRVFTTRPDTLFGATFMLLAPEHPWASDLATPEHRAAVAAYCQRVSKMDRVTRRAVRDKTGVFTGSYAINPATGEEIPIWIADYILAEYGTGAIMAVPAHDPRDFEFAHLFGLPIVRVIGVEGESVAAMGDAAYEGPGRLVNSGCFDGLEVEAAKMAIPAWLVDRGTGERQVQYRLHDWCISRQRYWGPPIPILYCEQCGIVPVPEAQLPVVLPDIDDFRPDGSGVAPLARVKTFVETSCPRCGGEARRETDVSDTFLDSAWYFLRYPSARRDDVPFDQALTRKWLPVDMYIGGNEHAVLHLLYTRFITMALHDMGFLDFEEPFKRFRAHGLIIKDGAKMSKSRGNVVNPDAYIEKHGADAFRLYMMFLGPYEEGGDFRDEGIIGVRRFLDGIWRMARELDEKAVASEELRRATNRAIAKVQADLEHLHYNTAIAALMTLLNDMRRLGPADRETVETSIQLLAPLAPHFAEEVWQGLGHAQTIFDSSWPHVDEALTVDETVEVAVQVNGKVRSRIAVPRGAPEGDVIAAVLADERIRTALAGKAIRRQYVVPGRLVSLVT
jgi:leucyl-tRNA synthetase